MRFSYQLEAIITHALSQLTHRWLPVPMPSFLADGKKEMDVRCDPHAISLSGWLDYMNAQISSLSESPWVTHLARQAMSPMGLATVIYDNLLKVEAANAKILDFFHTDYPYLLKHIPDPPSALITLGDLSLLSRPKIAIVGSRKASDFAFQEARCLGKKLADAGHVIVSGGAMGCDAAAHLGALESSISPVPTIVVMAGGLHRFHPQCLRSLFVRIEEGGGIFLSERLWDYPAKPFDFPVRNRIIAGLATHILVMQAAVKSGALKTATYAIEQGREVYVLIHDDDDVRAVGSRQLITEGAYPFHSSSDFLSTRAMF